MAGAGLPDLNDPIAVIAHLLKGWQWTRPRAAEAGAKMLIGALDGAGFVVVPKEPTPTMVESGRAELSHGDKKMQTHARVLWVWAAMLGAAEIEATAVHARATTRAGINSTSG